MVNGPLATGNIYLIELAARSSANDKAEIKFADLKSKEATFFNWNVNVFFNDLVFTISGLDF